MVASADAVPIYNAVQLSAIVGVLEETLATLSKDLRDARQRIGELEEEATKP